MQISVVTAMTQLVIAGEQQTTQPVIAGEQQTTQPVIEGAKRLPSSLRGV